MARRRTVVDAGVDLRGVLIEREVELMALYAAIGWPRHRLEALEAGEPVTVHGWQVARHLPAGEVDPRTRYVLEADGGLTPYPYSNRRPGWP